VGVYIEWEGVENALWYSCFSPLRGLNQEYI